jgi:hypothetical protein
MDSDRDQDQRGDREEDAGRAAFRMRFDAIRDDPTIQIVSTGHKVAAIERELLYLDRSLLGTDSSFVTNELMAAGGQPFSTEEWSRRCAGDDAAVAENRLRHLDEDLQLELWDFRARVDADADFDMDGLVRSFQGKGDARRSPVSAVTVYGSAEWHVGPYGPPVATDAPASLPPPRATPPPPARLRYAVLDTGIPAGYGGLHPHLAHTVDASSDPDAPIYSTAPELLMDAGHGLFIWDVSYRSAAALAPALMKRVARDRDGLTFSELQIVSALQNLAQQVCADGDGQLLINMSFAGVTPGDVSPAGLGAELQHMKRQGLDFLVVAAAGNDGLSPSPNPTEPHWPAAFSTAHYNVVSIGALDARTGAIADFSCRGWWVDAWAEGTDIDGAYLPGEYASSGDTFPYPGDPDAWARWQGTSFAAPRVAAAIASQATTHGQTLLGAWTSLRAAAAAGPGGQPGVIIDVPALAPPV